MRASIFPIAFAALVAAPAFAQDSAVVSKTLYFAQPAAPQVIQEAINIIRSVTEIVRITANNQSAAINLSGTADQVAAAEWLLHQLDLPAGVRPPTPAQYVFPDARAPAVGGSPQVRVFYLAHLTTPQEVQELVNGIRATAEITRITAFNQLHAIVSRASPNKTALAEWLVQRLDLPSAPAAAPSPNPAAFAYQPDYVRDTAVMAGVFYLANARQPQDIQQIVNSLRSLTEMTRITAFNQDAALVLRGDANQVALAEWLVSRMDKPAGPQSGSPMEFQMVGVPNPVVELYYLAHIASPQDIQMLVNSIRSTTQMTRITACNGPRIIALRGAGAQIAQATALVQEMDKPPAQ